MALNSGVITEDAIKSGTRATGGILTDQIVTIYDITKPQHYPYLVRRYGNQYDNFVMFFQNLGRMEATPNDVLNAWEENWLHESLKVASNSSQEESQGAGVTIAVAEADYGGSNVYPRVGDILTLSNEMQCIITAKTDAGSTWNLTVKPLRNDYNTLIPAFSAGDEIAITSAAFGYGTTQPEGVVVGHTPRAFQAQVIKETFELEGQEFTRDKWIKVMEGASYDYYYNEGMGAMEHRMGLKWDGAVTFGIQDDGSVTVPSGDGSGNEIKTTHGMVPWIRALGKTIETTGGSLFDLDYMDTASLHMKRNGATTNIGLFICGNLMAQGVENAFVDATAGSLLNTGVDYTKVEQEVFKGNRELSVSYNIKTVTKGGITWMIKPHDNWSNPKTFGLTGYSMESLGIMLPWGSTRDAKTGLKTMNMGMKYIANNGYSRKMEVWSVKGAGGGTYVTAIDKASHYLRSHMMFYLLAANQGVILDPLTLNVSYTNT